MFNNEDNKIDTAQTDTLKVLVVEDEVIIRKSLEFLLKNQGCTVLKGTGYGEEAVRRARQESPDIVFMDINLKGDLDGIRAAERISEEGKAGILFVSAYDYEEEVEKDPRINLLGYMNKPVSERELTDFIKAFGYK
jgi:CheY-like chemotaxis protein